MAVGEREAYVRGECGDKQKFYQEAMEAL